MWYWIVTWHDPLRNVDGECVSWKGYDTQEQARNNLIARLSERPPNIDMPKGAYITNTEVVYQSGRL